MKSLSLTFIKVLLASCLLFCMFPLQAADYIVDSKGGRAAVYFKTSHLGFSYILGRFNVTEGSFSWDADNPNDSKVTFSVDTNSIDTNHAERDRRLLAKELFNIATSNSKAEFVSTSYTDNGDGTGRLKGDLTFLGHTQEIDVAVTFIGEGDDPWGNYRAGFEGDFVFNTEDFQLESMIGPLKVFINVNIEGIRL